jgi:hypothetical protein
MQQTTVQILKAGVIYFALVFGTGLVLGTVRTLWVELEEHSVLEPGRNRLQ